MSATHECAGIRLMDGWHSTVSVLRSAAGWRLAAVWRLAAGGDWRLALGGDWRLVLGGRLEKLVISHQPPQNDPLFVYLGLFSTSLDLFFAGFALKLFPMQKCQVLVG